MSQPITKTEALSLIEKALADVERAIQHRPPQIAAVYQKGRDAFIDGQSTATDTEWSRSMSFSLDELSLMHRFMFSSSFMSAWYHLAVDKARRDKAAQSCSLLIAGGLDLDPEQVMNRYIEYEQVWRQTMKSEHIAPRRFPIFGIIIVLIVLAIILKFVLGK